MAGTLNRLLEIDDKNVFVREWGTSDDIGRDQNKWSAIEQLFFNPNEWVLKERNIWHNELRERALFTIFQIEDGNRLFTTIPNLQQLKTKWMECLNTCIETWCLQNQVPLETAMFSKLVKLAGRKYKWDFELIDTRPPAKSIKIEFKFSAAGSTNIQSLAQFNAINTESASAKEIFGGETSCYLDYFWSNGLQEMCTAVNIVKPSNITTWKKTAKVTSPPASAKPELQMFHDSLRNLTDAALIAQKKVIVNRSFETFIRDSVDKLNANRNKVRKLFDSQMNKFYCIFTNGNFFIDTIPPFDIISIIQSTSQPHAFIINTTMPLYNIKADMSWGNGGAGNNNPRIKFSLVTKLSHGGSDSDILQTTDSSSIDEDPKDEEYADGDPIKDIFSTIMSDKDSTIDLNNYMVLRSGKLLKKGAGGSYNKRSRRANKRSRRVSTRKRRTGKRSRRANKKK